MKKFLSILLAFMMVFSSVSYAVPSAVGTMDAAVEMPEASYEAPAFEESASLSAVDTTQYGKMVLRFTYDNLTAGTDYLADFKVTTKSLNSLNVVGGELGSGAKSGLQNTIPFAWDGENTASNNHAAVVARQESDGNVYLELQGTGSTARFGIRDYNGTGFATDGHYIMTVDVLSASNKKPFTKAHFQDGTGDDRFYQDEYITDEVTPGEWSTLVISQDDIHDSLTVNAGTYNHATNTYANYIFLYDELASGEVVGIDNLTLWWVPAEITHKVTHTSYDGGIEFAESDVVLGGGIKSVDEIAQSFASDDSFLSAGYYLDKIIMDGVEYSGSDKLLLNEEKTFTVVWDKFNIIDEYGFEFNSVEDYNAMATNNGLRSPGKSHAYYGTGDYSFLDWNEEGGYVTINVDASESAKTAATDNGYKYAFVHDHGFYIPSLREGDVGTVPAGVFDTLEIRLRYHINIDEADYASSITYYNVNGSNTQTFNAASFKAPSYLYMKIGSAGWANKGNDFANKSVSAIQDQWITLTIDASTYGFDTQTLTALRYDYNLPDGSTIDIDYIRFIGEDHPNAIVDMGGKSDAGKYSMKYTDTTTVADVLSSIDYVGNEIVTGLSATEGGAALDGSTLISTLGTDDVTLYAIYGANPNVGDYGELLFEINFNDMATGTVDFGTAGFFVLSQLGGSTGTRYAGDPANLKMFNGSGTTYPAQTVEIAERASGDNYLLATANASNAYNLFQIYTNDRTTYFSTDEGWLVTTYDVLWTKTSLATPHNIIYNRSQAAELADQNERVYGSPDGTWGSVLSVFDSNEIGKSGLGGNSATMLTTQVNYLKIHGGDGMVAGDTYGIDNIRLWWIPKTVDITVAAGDNTSVSDTVYTIDPSVTTVGDLMDMVYGDRRSVTGLSKTEGGELLSEDTLLTYAYPTTLYATWGPEIDILEDYSLEFNTASSITDGTAKFARLRDNTHVTWNEDGYMTMHFEAADGYTGVYDNYILVNTISTDHCLTAGSVDKLAIRVRFHGLVAGSYLTSNSTSSYNLNFASFQSCLHVSPWDTAFGSSLTTTNWASALSNNFENDKWYIIYIDADTFMPNGAGGMRFDTPYPMPDGASMDIDYIRFLPTNQYTLTVDNGENTSATVVTMQGFPATTVADVIAKIEYDEGDKKIVGLSRTAGGSALPASEAICTTGDDTTVYAIWEDYEYLEGYGYEFNDGKLPYNSNIVTNNATRTLTVQDGYLTVDLTATEGYTGTWDTQFYLPISTNTHYNPDKYVPAGVVTNIRARVRFRGTGTETQSLTTSNSSNPTATFNPASPGRTYIHWAAPGNTWGTNLKSYNYTYVNLFSHGIVDGEWFTMDFDTTSGNLNLYDNGVGYLRFDFPYPMPSGTKIDVDYIRLVGDNDKLPSYDGIGEYGEKVFELNFDKYAAGTYDFPQSSGSDKSLYNLGATFNPAFNAANYTPKIILCTSAMTNEIVADGNGGNYLKTTATSAGTTPFVYLRNFSSNSAQVLPYAEEDGYFVVTYDVKNETSASVPHTFRFNKANLIEHAADNFVITENGEWDKVVLYFDKEINPEKVQNGTTFSSTGEVDIIKWHNASGVKAGESICIDNFTLWFVPKTTGVVINNSAIGEENTLIAEYPTCGMTNEELVALLPQKEGIVFNGLSKTAGGALVHENRAPVSQMLYSVWAVDTILTVDMGYNTKLSDITIQIPAGSSVKVSDIEAKFIDHGDKIFAGLSLTENGTKLSSTDVISATDSGALTIYALWDEYYTNDFYSVEFNNGKYGYEKDTNKFKVGRNAAYTDADACIDWNEDGYITVNFVASDDAKTAATSNGMSAALYDGYIELSSLASDDSYIPAGTVSHVAVRMRVRGLPEATTSYWDAANNTSRNFNPSSVVPYFFYVTDTNSWGSKAVQFVKDFGSTSAYRDAWFTVYIDATAAIGTGFNMDEENLYRFRLDFPETMPDGAAIDIDYIRFVSLDEENNYSAPASRKDRVSVRIKDDDADRNGIRVLADITTATAEPATEFGYMFTSSTRWNMSSGGTERSWYELGMDLYDPTSSFIKVGFIKENGEQTIRFFEDDDDLIKSFAAVLYNIPTKNYKSPFIVRPFAKYNGTYAYGEPFEINFLDSLEMIANSTGDDNAVAYYNECAADYAAYLNANAEYDADETNAQLAAIMSSASSIKSNLVIPTNDTAPTVSGNVVTMKVWKDGALTTINVSTKNAYPELIDENGMISEAYAEKPCVYYLSNGVYYIKSLGRATNAGGDYVGIEKTDARAMEANVDANALFLSELKDGEVDSPFQRLPIDDELTNGQDSFFIGDYATGKFDFTFQRANSATRTISTGKTAIIADDSKVVAKYNFPDGSTEWVSFTKTQLLKMGLDSNSRDIADGIDFTNLTYVVSNNTTTATGKVNQREYENLAVLVGEVDVPTTVAASTKNFLAAKYNKVIVKTSGTTNYVTVKFTRADGVSDSIKYYAYGTTADGGRLFDVDLHGIAKYHSTISSINVTSAGSITYSYLVEDPEYYSSADLASMDKTMIFQDTNYENGFYVRDMDQKMKKAEYQNYTFANNGATPVWMIDPWYAYDYSGTKSDYELYTHASPTATSLSDNKGSKVVKFNGTKTSTYADGSTHTGSVLSMTLNSRTIYHEMTHAQMQAAGMVYWPHLLIEQSKEIYPVDVERNSAGADKIFLEMDIKMTDYTLDKDSYFEDVGSKILSFLLYSYLRPKESPTDRIWFGVQLCSESNPNYPTWNRDTGASAYIYNIPQEVVFQGIANSFYQQIENDISEKSLTGSGTDSTSKDWVHISLDLTPYIDIAIDWANREDAFGLGTLTRDDFYFDGVNIGFETHGNIDGTFEIANFNFVAYNEK